MGSYEIPVDIRHIPFQGDAIRIPTLETIEAVGGRFGQLASAGPTRFLVESQAGGFFAVESEPTGNWGDGYTWTGAVCVSIPEFRALKSLRTGKGRRL